MRRWHRCDPAVLDAGHDVNGNPRRALRCSCGLAVDEGYEGTGPARLRRDFPRLVPYPHLTRVRVTVAHYRLALRRAAVLRRAGVFD